MFLKQKIRSDIVKAGSLIKAGSVHFQLISKERNRRIGKSHSCSQHIRDSSMDLGINRTGKEGLRTVYRERKARRWMKGIAGFFIFSLPEMSALESSLALCAKLLPACNLNNESLENPRF